MRLFRVTPIESALYSEPKSYNAIIEAKSATAGCVQAILMLLKERTQILACVIDFYFKITKTKPTNLLLVYAHWHSNRVRLARVSILIRKYHASHRQTSLNVAKKNSQP